MGISKRFIIDKNIRFVFAFLHLNEVEILQRAKLPVDFFDKKMPSLNSDQYYALWEAVVESSSERVPIPLMMEKLPMFTGISVPIMAALCSTDFERFIRRIKEYKPLIGPLVIDIDDNSPGEDFSFSIYNIEPGKGLHPLIVASELVFFIKIIRFATSKQIIPLKIETVTPLVQNEYIDYFGIKPETSDRNRITFSYEDVKLPFTMSDETVWESMEPELKKRLNELEVDSSYSAKVRSVITELLPMGNCSIDMVSEKLCISSRTLQRKLKAESTNFQQQLNHTRELMAKHYLTSSELNISEISFLLGYEELSSFSRAFTIWTGSSPDSYRSSTS